MSREEVIARMNAALASANATLEGTAVPEEPTPLWRTLSPHRPPEYVTVEQLNKTVKSALEKFVTQKELDEALDVIDEILDEICAKANGANKAYYEKVLAHIEESDKLVRTELNALRIDVMNMISRELATLPETLQASIDNKAWKDKRRTRAVQ